MDPLWTQCKALQYKLTSPRVWNPNEMPLWWFYTSAILGGVTIGSIPIWIMVIAR